MAAILIPLEFYFYRFFLAETGNRTFSIHAAFLSYSVRTVCVCVLGVWQARINIHVQVRNSIIKRLIQNQPREVAKKSTQI